MVSNEIVQLRRGIGCNGFGMIKRNSTVEDWFAAFKLD
jgi:hypothetical protein